MITSLPHRNFQEADPIPPGIPFDSAEEAWFWFMAARRAGLDGARRRGGQSRLPRPCEPVDILTILDRLYRGRVLLYDHLLVLHHFGKKFSPPDPSRPSEAQAHTLWREAMARLRVSLIRRGIVIDRTENWNEEERV